MKKIITSFWVFSILFCCSSPLFSKNIRVLVFSATKGARHRSITQGKIALMKIGVENKWQMDTTENSGDFTDGNLKKYKAIIFLNTTGDVFNEDQQDVFKRYIENGGSYIGIHSASDTEKEWPWYNDLVGGIFANHPKPQRALYRLVSKDHPAVSFMPDTVTRLEEIYNLKSFKSDLVKVLVTVDESSYTGGTMGAVHPAVWYHQFDGGKAFYTAWGHNPDSYSEPLFLKQITEAIKWAISN